MALQDTQNLQAGSGGQAEHNGKGPAAEAGTPRHVAWPHPAV